MTADRAIVQVTGRLSSRTLAQLTKLDGHLQQRTLVRIAVRDEAALQGVLRRLHDLGLELIEVRSRQDNDSARLMEVTVNGSIGDLALESLSDYIEVRQTATRLALANRDVLNEALALLVGEARTVEYATASEATAP